LATNEKSPYVVNLGGLFTDSSLLGQTGRCESGLIVLSLSCSLFMGCLDSFVPLERNSQPLAGSLAFAHSRKFLSYFFDTHFLHLLSIPLENNIEKDQAEKYPLGVLLYTGNHPCIPQSQSSCILILLIGFEEFAPSKLSALHLLTQPPPD
jgi:hypothetical protein